MDPVIFDSLDRTLTAEGPDTAIDRMCTTLKETKDYHALFYALLLRKRHELGVSPLPTAPSNELPEAALAPYENGIREAARVIGRLFLDAGNLPQAFGYFHMIGETDPIHAALETYQPAEDEDIQPLVQIAFVQGVHRRKGFEWILQRYGICNAITTLSGQPLSPLTDDLAFCLRMLVRALYAELRERLAAEIERHDGQRPPEAEAPTDTPGVVLKLIKDRAWLFEDCCYHIDTSHLSSVVQMSVHLPRCPELALARELCAYGQRLTGHFMGQGEPPFEDQYRAYDLYLSILQGENLEECLGYFRERAEEAKPEEIGTFPAEVLVNLLVKLERPKEALAVARKYLARSDSRNLTCPGVADLCREVGDYRTLAEVAREQGDVVHFLAGRLVEKQKRKHEELRREIVSAIEQGDRGESVPLNEETLARIREEGHKRLQS